MRDGEFLRTSWVSELRSSEVIGPRTRAEVDVGWA